jgi:uncharacterized protein DUF3467
MSDILKQVLTPEQIKERTKSENVPILYFNYTRTAASFFDVRLFFGQGSVTPKGEQTFEEQLCVVCTPEFAKTLRDNLTLAVEKYEQTFGTVRATPSAAQVQAVNAKPSKKNTKKLQ